METGQCIPMTLSNALMMMSKGSEKLATSTQMGMERKAGP